MFAGMRWYDPLSMPDDPEEQSAWYLTKDSEPAWYVCLLKAALRYAVGPAPCIVSMTFRIPS